MNTPDERRGCTSASNAQADALCAGRHLAQQGLPDETSDDAAFGIAIHAALATGDSTKLTPEQFSIYESCQDITGNLIRDTFGPDASKVKDFTEQRLWCIVNKQFEHSGKPDLVARHGGVGLIIEFKCLPGEVGDSAWNQQLRDQAVLAAGHYLLDEVHVAIVQPLVTQSPSLCRYDKAALKQAEAEMFARVIASNDPQAKRVAGPEQCKFCLARHVCSTRAEYLAESMVPAVASFASVPVKAWTPEQRIQFCERAGMVTKWIDECKAELKRLMKEQPDAVPGWGLEVGSIKRPVVKPELLHERFLAAGGTTEQFMACVDIGKGDLKDAVRAATNLKGKALDAKLPPGRPFHCEKGLT